MRSDSAIHETVTASKVEAKAETPKPKRTSAKVTEAEAKEAKATLEKQEKQITSMANEAIKLGSAKGGFKSLIDKIRNDTRKLMENINLCAASCIVHGVVHGQVTPMNDLINAMGDGLRANAMRKFFEGCGPVTWDDEDKRLVYDRSKATALKRDYNKDKVKFTSALVREPYYKFSPPAPYAGFNLVEELERLIKRAEDAPSALNKAKEKGREIEGKVDINGLDKVKKVYHALQS